MEIIIITQLLYVDFKIVYLLFNIIRLLCISVSFMVVYLTKRGLLQIIKQIASKPTLFKINC